MHEEKEQKREKRKINSLIELEKVRGKGRKKEPPK